MPKYAYSDTNNFANDYPLKVKPSREEAIAAAIEDYGGTEVCIAELTEISVLPFAVDIIQSYAAKIANEVDEGIAADMADEYHAKDVMAALGRPLLVKKLAEAFSQWWEEEDLLIYEVADEEWIDVAEYEATHESKDAAPPAIQTAVVGPMIQMEIDGSDPNRIFINFLCKACGEKGDFLKAGVISHSCATSLTRVGVARQEASDGR